MPQSRSFYQASEPDFWQALRPGKNYIKAHYIKAHPVRFLSTLSVGRIRNLRIRNLRIRNLRICNLRIPKLLKLSNWFVFLSPAALNTATAFTYFIDLTYLTRFHILDAFRL